MFARDASNLAVALGVSEGSVPAGEVKPASGNLTWFVDDAASAEYREKKAAAESAAVPEPAAEPEAEPEA